MLNHLTYESPSRATQTVAQRLAHTLVIADGNYPFHSKRADMRIDYHALLLSLTRNSATSAAYWFTKSRERDESLLTALVNNQWTIRAVPENIHYEHIMIRKALRGGMGSLYDLIVVISSASRIPELDELRASGKHIVRCVFAQDVTERMHQNADEVITLEELGVLY